MTEDEIKPHPTEKLLYTVIDPKAKLSKCPAMTTLLYQVCNNQIPPFEKAIELIELFMEAAYDLGKQDAIGAD
jgi:hypothetical protein